MNCECENCRGAGTVECDECDGTGEIDCGIHMAKIPTNHPQHLRLRELRDDAEKAEDAAHKLIEMKPEHADSYRLQLATTIAQIETEWKNTLKEKP